MHLSQHPGKPFCFHGAVVCLHFTRLDVDHNNPEHTPTQFFLPQWFSFVAGKQMAGKEAGDWVFFTVPSLYLFPDIWKQTSSEL